MKGRKMRLPNGYGGVVKLSGNRRRPYAARITTGWHINDITGKRIQHARVGFSRFDSGWQSDACNRDAGVEQTGEPARVIRIQMTEQQQIDAAALLAQEIPQRFPL